MDEYIIKNFAFYLLTFSPLRRVLNLLLSGNGLFSLYCTDMASWLSYESQMIEGFKLHMEMSAVVF